MSQFFQLGVITRIGTSISLCFAMFLTLAGCSTTEKTTILSFSPTSAAVGSTLTIYGTGFNTGEDGNWIGFSGHTSAYIAAETPTELRVVIPEGTTSGYFSVGDGATKALSPSSLTIESAGSSEPPSRPPVVVNFAPINGSVGTTVTITGSNFASLPTSNTVAFGEAISTVTAASATTLEVTVPQGAETGRITVSTIAGSFTTAASFTVRAVPDPPLPIATAIDDTQINLNWNLIGDATAYNIYRSTTPGVSATVANKINPTPVVGPPYTDTGLTDGTTYYYVITSVGANGESVRSIEVSATPTTPPPSPPIINGFSPTNGVVGTAVVVTGSFFSSTATGNTVTFGGSVPAVVNAASTTSLTVTVPAGAKTGTLSLTTGAGTAQSATEFVVLQPSPPIINGFSPTNGVVGSAVVVTGSFFSSTATSNTVTFGGSVPAVVNAASTTSLTVTVPAGAETGTLSVTTGAGTAQSATEFVVLQPPAPPTGVVATPVTSSQVNLIWNLVTGATGYNIYRSTTPGVSIIQANKLTTTSVSGPPYADSGLTCSG